MLLNRILCSSRSLNGAAPEQPHDIIVLNGEFIIHLGVVLPELGLAILDEGGLHVTHSVNDFLLLADLGCTTHYGEHYHRLTSLQQDIEQASA